MRSLKFDLTACFSSKSSVHQHLLTFCSTDRWATVVLRSISQLAGDPWGARFIPVGCSLHPSARAVVGSGPRRFQASAQLEARCACQRTARCDLSIPAGIRGAGEGVGKTALLAVRARQVVDQTPKRPAKRLDGVWGALAVVVEGGYNGDREGAGCSGTGLVGTPPLGRNEGGTSQAGPRRGQRGGQIRARYGSGLGEKTA